MSNQDGGSVMLWAFDPIAEDKKTQFKTVRAAAKFAKAVGASIEPVCVLSPSRLKVPEVAYVKNETAFESEAERIAKGWVKELKLPMLLAPKLLKHGIYADTNAVSTLLKYARERGASLVSLGTHTRKRWERFMMGSFAESLILKSDVPLFVVNPKYDIPAKFTHVFFPTDFSESSHVAFKTIVEAASLLKAKMTLYFKFDYVVQETLEAIALTSMYAAYLKKDLAQRKQTAESWAAEAKVRGVKVAILLDETPGYVPEAIQKAAAKSKANMIAMASHSGAVATALLGSVARQTIRVSTVPVWVVHPAR